MSVIDCCNLVESLPPQEDDLKPQTKSISELSPSELVALISPRYEEHNLPEETSNYIITGKITGKHFTRLRNEYMKAPFPTFTEGDKLSLMILRDDLCEEEKNRIKDKSSSDVKTLEDASFDKLKQEHYRERFHKFDTDVIPTDCYRQNAIVQSSMTERPGNLLEPVHYFSYITYDTHNLYASIAAEVIPFAAACLNERTNGTLHFGINPRSHNIQMEGVVKGLCLSRHECIRLINSKILQQFYNDQHTLVFKCIRPPKFIDVSSKDATVQTYVIEVDIVPKFDLVGEEAFFVKETSGHPVLYLFNENGISPQHITEDKVRTYITKNRSLLSECRKREENMPKCIPLKEDLRQKMLNLLGANNDHMPKDSCPLVFLSPMYPSRCTDDELHNFEFLIELDPSAFFDFDFSKDRKGVNYYLETCKNQALNTLTTDNFCPQSFEQYSTKENTFNWVEEMRQSKLKPWIFCNGYEAMSKSQMSKKEWKFTSSKGFKEAIRFYRGEIPVGRALVIFLLCSNQYDVLLEAAEEVILNFKNEWVVIAENHAITDQWFAELIRRETIDKEEMEKRSVIGMNWGHVNQTIKQISSPQRSHCCEIPTSIGVYCHLPEKKRNELHDLDILSRNECDDPAFLKDTVKLEEKQIKVSEDYYHGAAISWWNFWFSDHVVTRDVHQKLEIMLRDALDGKNTDDENRIGLITTTEQTVDQIIELRNFDEKDDPKPLLLLIDNGEEDKISDLFSILQNKAKIAARRSNSEIKVFCVLLLCIRRAIIPTQLDQGSIALKHFLSQKELFWFQTKRKSLNENYNDQKGIHPKYLISFNILTENFNQKYIRSTAKEFVEAVDDLDERRLLKYLSLLQMFDSDCPPLPTSAFDPIMISYKKGLKVTYGLVRNHGRQIFNSWDTKISDTLQLLLNRSSQAGLAKQLSGLSIIHPLFAKEIFSCFKRQPQCTSQIVLELLNSPLFSSCNMSSNEVLRVVQNMMKKREENEMSIKMKFSRLIMKVLEEENDLKAAEILIKVFQMTKDAMVCQQIARLYIHCQKWESAVKYARTATEIKPQSSFLWDTYGQVYMKQLLAKYLTISQSCDTSSSSMNATDVINAIDIAKMGIEKFQKEQELSEYETSRTYNDAGYYGELRMIILLLDMLRTLGCPKELLRKYLTVPTCLPPEMSYLNQVSVEFLKGLEENAEVTLRTIEEKLTQLKDGTYNSVHVFVNPMIIKNAVGNIKFNLNTYFGEEGALIGADVPEREKADLRRRYIRSNGGRSLFNYLRIDDAKDLYPILDMLLQNVLSDNLEIFDIVNLITVVIALKIKKEKHTKISYNELVRLSRKCYEKVISSKERRQYLEAYMYLVLFNWPTESRSKDIICSIDQLRDATKRWKEAFYENHPRLKELANKSHGKKETTIFFLGKGIEMDTIVHYEELGDPYNRRFIKGDKIWETPDFVTKLLRIQGTLINEGTEVSCNITPLTGGLTPFVVPTSLQIVNRSLWQKKIYFLLDARKFQEAEQGRQTDMGLNIPLLMQNKIPEGFETDDKLDVGLRPDEPEENDYEEIPIDQFGLAMLRGMGWQEGQGIGKNNKAVAPVNAVLRPKGLGLGADRSQAAQLNDSKKGSGKNDNEEALVLKKGAYCVLLKGANKDMYGIVSCVKVV
ncbi:Hypothetical predicted protein [Mytilus galloprovincialis]|uniref:G-patch domain-containing protein n=1 Tax=Mytilus galloprovincialis TaxID=29158 RepID=A0A8B6DUF7_MYTGA|nr:Hypothetical predicted protein [Mytilus galloprovincialis]